MLGQTAKPAVAVKPTNLAGKKSTPVGNPIQRKVSPNDARSGGGNPSLSSSFGKATVGHRATIAQPSMQRGYSNMQPTDNKRRRSNHTNEDQPTDKTLSKFSSVQPLSK